MPTDSAATVPPCGFKKHDPWCRCSVNLVGPEPTVTRLHGAVHLNGECPNGVCAQESNRIPKENPMPEPIRLDTDEALSPTDALSRGYIRSRDLLRVLAEVDDDHAVYVRVGTEGRTFALTGVATVNGGHGLVLECPPEMDDEMLKLRDAAYLTGHRDGADEVRQVVRNALGLTDGT